MIIMYYIGFIISFFSPIGMYFFSKRECKFSLLTCLFWFSGDSFFMIYNYLIGEYPLSIFFLLNNIMTIRLFRKTLNEIKIANLNKSNL